MAKQFRETSPETSGRGNKADTETETATNNVNRSVGTVTGNRTATATVSSSAEGVGNPMSTQTLQNFVQQAFPQPAPLHCCIDIETISCDPVEAEEWARVHWSPAANWKPETIGQRYLDAIAKKKERLALLDKAPILSVCIGTESEIRLFHWCDCSTPNIGTAAIERHPDEGAMLNAVRDWLSRCDSDTILNGHNIKGFDLRKLRNRMMGNGIRPPDCFLERGQRVFDSMLEWSRYTLNDSQFVALSEILDTLHIPNHKASCNGGMVQELYEAKRFDELLTYAVLDVVAEYAVFCRLAGLVGA
jgi:hypothetical protein